VDWTFADDSVHLGDGKTWRSRLMEWFKGCKTEQYDCVDVYVRIRTSDGAAASIRAVPSSIRDVAAREISRTKQRQNRVLLANKAFSMIIHTFLVSWSDSSILNSILGYGPLLPWGCSQSQRSSRILALATLYLQTFTTLFSSASSPSPP